MHGAPLASVCCHNEGVRLLKCFTILTNHRNLAVIFIWQLRTNVTQKRLLGYHLPLTPIDVYRVWRGVT
jgi:hypothetical protein